MEEVKKTFKGFYWEINADEDHDIVVNELARIMRLRFSTSETENESSPSKILPRPPRILILGPPGSGKTTLSKIIAQKFGLINVGAAELLQQEIANKTIVGQEVEELLSKGKIINDDIMAELVNKRINSTDCKVHGWIMEGFPKTEGQITMLKSMKQMPALIVSLELDDDVVYERHEYKKIDPITGEIYNLNDTNPLPKPEILNRLVSRDCDKHAIVKERLNKWKEFAPKLNDLLNTHKTLTLYASKSVQILVNDISETIESMRNERA